ncbi:hypothetical protein H9Y04_15270 [Streptomyces sp. TRM66268-LWL]|uniref:Uncharacterized protein n=1 Tax=Streptomyces polyasparticus TaxID=2767826 RepID=A0ABR7SET4_9ACTN|nr:hypothetical protein [Streptomyces polyasparticus]MBC9713928.1 hypothetical protein [Streptomyces polyasparticus]
MSDDVSATEPTGFEHARAVADAILFEGYVLYPYRASAPKNRMRWQFGVLAPPGSDRSETTFAQTECLAVVTGPQPSLVVKVRFLQAERRSAYGSGEPPWDEGVVREVDARVSLTPGTVRTFPFHMPGRQTPERTRQPLSGLLRIETSCPPCDGLHSVRIRVENHSAGPVAPRSRMLLGSLIGTHTLIAADQARFLSLADPPAWAAQAAAGCDNRHTWPVLVDDTTVLSSPIILEDRPRIAPESTADFYDATEIDELLTLRTLTLTDEEKRAARATDARAAAIVDHAEAMTGPELERLHGRLRRLDEVDGPNPSPGDTAAGWDEPAAEAEQGVAVRGGRAVAGARVRLCPGSRRADAQDMFLHGRTARVAAVLHDVDGGRHVAVILDDDPAAELHDAVGRHWHFAPDEVELL